MNQTLRYTAKKILWTIPILVGITFLAFGLGLVARGDPATNRASADPNYIPTEEEIQELRAMIPFWCNTGAGSGTQPTVI